jgi:arginyl-tRNA synthetase
MRLQDQIAQRVHAALLAAQAQGALPAFAAPTAETIVVERAKQAEHGDFATPLALSLARAAKLPPRRIAEAIAAQLPTGDEDMLRAVEVAGAGFINIWLSPRWLVRQVDRILEAGPHFADLTIGAGQRAQVEFVSANPTGPLTVGHGRGAVIGDTLSNVLQAAGYAVTREYYFNDGGLQMRILADSVRIRLRQLLGEDLPFPDNHYVGDYIKDIAQQMLDQRGATALDLEWTVFRDRAVEAIFAEIRATLDRLGVHFDVYFNEMDLYAQDRPDNVWQVLDGLRERDMAYEAEGAVWLRATSYGAEKDRVLVRSTGEPTYRLPDIAYHVDKLRRGFDLVVDVLGADHIAEYPDIQAALTALGYDAARVRVVVNQFVTLVKGGEVVKMSTRKANYVTLDELIDEVGVDAVRYFMISRTPNSQFAFDIDLAKRASDDNPVFYVQYAHARTAGILERNAPRVGIAYDLAANVGLLTHAAEAALVLVLLRLEDTLAQCAETLEPHVLTYYAQDLATAFSIFYRDCRVLDPDDVPLSQARLKLVSAAQIALARTLGLMGMRAPSEM